MEYDVPISHLMQGYEMEVVMVVIDSILCEWFCESDCQKDQREIQIISG